ncbi:hypothetical protein FB451DRAFT_1397431 [Mycena latifolia]|nr:hypothetical protein FB451DRAFT_1397431 [Mycena latifolia]
MDPVDAALSMDIWIVPLAAHTSTVLVVALAEPARRWGWFNHRCQWVFKDASTPPIPAAYRLPSTDSRTDPIPAIASRLLSGNGNPESMDLIGAARSMEIWTPAPNGADVDALAVSSRDDLCPQGIKGAPIFLERRRAAPYEMSTSNAHFNCQRAFEGTTANGPPPILIAHHPAPMGGSTVEDFKFSNLGRAPRSLAIAANS